MQNGFLPINKREMIERGWQDYDFLLVSGDAYVDHPSFGPAIISRVLEAAGYRVCILSQPDWKSKEAFLEFGAPRLAVLITSGNLDSMVCHYTVSKKRRTNDLYSPNNQAGKRPDRAVIVYSNRVREAFSDIPIILGGIEASLRRFAHYDYWQDKVRRSVLFDAQADLLVYGMGEKAIVEIADSLKNGVNIKDITNIRGTCYIAGAESQPEGEKIASFEEVSRDKRAYAAACAMQYRQHNPNSGKAVIQPHKDKLLVQNPPQPPSEQKQLDFIYSLPYMRTYHPVYQETGGIKALEEVKFSITATRGCLGSCAFCALGFHQGRIIQTRSEKSIVNEAKNMVWDPDFKGYIHDVGGPSANLYDARCRQGNRCTRQSCLYPKICSNLDVSHKRYIGVLRSLKKIPEIKKVFIRSGIRFDYLLEDKDDTFFRELCCDHISGQLKVAPEHISKNVLKYMGKPGAGVYEKFSDRFYKINKEIGKEQYLVPYLMSSHPGSTLSDAIELALFLKRHNLNPQQVQDFYPTPGTIATAMYYTGLDPYTLKPVHVPKSYREKAMQRALLQFRNPANYKLVYEALVKEKRGDLIGYGGDSLIPPPRHKNTKGKVDKNGNDFRRKKGGTKDKGRVKRRNSKK